jgi:hypothetical protein
VKKRIIALNAVLCLPGRVRTMPAHRTMARRKIVRLVPPIFSEHAPSKFADR